MKSPIRRGHLLGKKTFEGKKDNPEFSEYYKKAMNLYDVMDEPKDKGYYSEPVILFVIGPDRNAVDCELACENIMIAATSFGHGSRYVGFGSMVTGDADVVKALELTDDERINGPIVLGYPRNLPEERALRMKKKGPMIKWI